MTTEMLTGPVAQAIGWALLHLLWQGTIVAAILAAALALLSKRSANVRYGVSCAALALVLVLGVATAFQAYEPKIVHVTPRSDASITIPITNSAAILAAVAKVTWRDRASALADAADDFLPGVVALWLAGVVFFSTRLLLTWIRAQRLVRQGAVDASPHWQHVAQRLADALNLKRAVRLLESAAVEVPSVIGAIRPVILLPASTLTGLTPEQLEMVLAHELAHIRRHDFFVNLLQAVVETLMFYHPAVWWMSQRVRIERENCCDDLAVAVCGNPLQYARALTRLEELRADAPELAVASNGGSLLDRIRRIAAGRAESNALPSRWAAAVAVLTVLAIAIAAPSMPAFAQRDKRVEAKKPSTTVTVTESRDDADTEDVDIEDDDLDDDVDVDVDHDVDHDVDVDVDHDTDPDLHLNVEVDVPAPPAPRPVVAPAPALAPLAFPAAPPTPVVAPAPVPHIAPGVPVVTLAPHPVVTPQAAIAGLFANDDDDDETPEPKRERRADGKLTVDELVALRIHDVTPEYIDQMRAIFPNLSIKSIASMRAVGVTPALIRDLRAAGITVNTANDASGLAALGVTAEYVRDMRAAGVDVKTAKQATQLRAMGVTPKFVKQLSDAGYKNLSVHELTRLAAAGVDANFIKDMAKYRD